MKERIVKYLVCPKCDSELNLKKSSVCKQTNHIISGELNCTSCKSIYQIIKGVPFFSLDISDSEVSQNIKNFGDEWNYFTSTIDEQLAKEELDSYFYTFVKYKDLDDKVVLDAGCGGGRFSYIISKETNAKEIFSVDLSNAVFTAFENTKHLDNVSIIQADIRKMPFKKKKLFDFIFSVGVVHHMPDPFVGFDCLVQQLKENSKILVWVYGKEGNFLYITFADPLRTILTSRLPFKCTLYFSCVLSLIVWGIIWLFYTPLNLILGKKVSNKLLPFNEYFNFFKKRGFRDFWRTVFDKMIPTIAHYISKEEFTNWLKSGNLKYQLYFRNGHSWLGIGEQSSSEKTSVKEIAEPVLVQNRV